MKKQILVIISPVFIVVICSIVIHLTSITLGVWAWLPWILTYWILTGIFVLVFGGVSSIKKWLSKPIGSWGWSTLAVLIGLAGLSMLITSWKLLATPQIILFWLMVGLLNPFFEEFFWRGLLLDYTKNWNSWISIIFFSLLFSSNHYFGIGVTSIGCRHPMLILNTFIIGLLYSWVYIKTKSLRWTIVGHSLADLFGLSIPVFLNLWIPPS
jgi:uncharacterized protein